MIVSILVDVADIDLWDAAIQYVVEPGEIVVYRSNRTADSCRSASFEVS